MKKLSKKLVYINIALVILPLFMVISMSSLIYLYEKRSKILTHLDFLGFKFAEHEHHSEKRFQINPLKKSDRQIPPLDIKDLKISENSDVIGQWSAPIDWNVTAIHSILLPDETIMTFGTYGIDKKEITKLKLKV